MVDLRKLKMRRPKLPARPTGRKPPVCTQVGATRAQRLCLSSWANACASRATKLSHQSAHPRGRHSRESRPPIEAIAICKIILEIDPSHTKTQQALAAFHASHSGPQAGLAALSP